MSQKLHGADLLAYVAANPNLPEKELAAGAGYATEVENEDGTTRLQIHTKPFYQELAIAQGIIKPATIGRSSVAGSRRGKGLSYKLKSNPNSGNVVLTGGYTEQIGLTPGEHVTVEVIEEAGEIVIKRVEETTEAEDSAAPAPSLVAAVA